MFPFPSSLLPQARRLKIDEVSHAVGRTRDCRRRPILHRKIVREERDLAAARVLDQVEQLCFVPQDILRGDKSRHSRLSQIRMHEVVERLWSVGRRHEST
jgi:hypothetical protein